MSSNRPEHRGNSTVTVWTIKTLTQAVAGTTDRFRINLPRFQRSVVWKEDQRTALINSISRGFPIGALLAYQRDGDPPTMELIDGLQRTKTLCDYVGEPLAWAPGNVATDMTQLWAPFSEFLNELDAAKHEAARHAINEAVSSWMKTTKDLKMQSGYATRPLLDAIDERLEAEGVGPSGVNDFALASFLDHLKDRLDISDVQVPVVLFQGEPSDLPDIFERLNTEGTKLSKYQVFAATWIHCKTVVNRQEVRDAVVGRYKALWDAGFEVDQLETGKEPEDFSLFEYLFGLGKVIGQEHAELFSAGDTSSEEPAPFMLFALLAGESPANVGRLPELLPTNVDGEIDPGGIEEDLEDALNFVKQMLRPVLGLKLNEQQQGKWPHGDYQMMSYVGRAAVGARVLRTASPASSVATKAIVAERQALSDAIPAHYLLDILSKTWRGALYSLVYESVWQLEEDKKPTVASEKYTRPPSRAAAQAVMDEWFDQDRMTRRQRERPNLRPVEKVFLRFMYSKLVSHYDNYAQVFELEHLFPVSRLAASIGPTDEGWPISCIANLALFPKALNREKSGKTISEYFADLKNQNPDQYTSDLAVIEPLLLCDVDEVSIKKDAKGHDQLTLDDYTAFLRARWTRMRDEVLKNLALT